MAYRKSSKNKSNKKKTTGRKRFSSKGQPSRFSKSGYGGRSRGSKRHIKKFDPSQFIRKVEEQTLAKAYIPKNMFSDFDLEDIIKKNIQHKGYENPTPVQDESIPFLLQ